MSKPPDESKKSNEPSPKGKKAKGHKVTPERVAALVGVQQSIEREKAEQRASEALRTARALALAHLPRTKTDDKQISKEVRLGKDLWVKVTYTAVGKVPLPFGEDRVILAGLVHMALDRRSPLITFEQAGEILDLFNRQDRSGAAYKRLRQRLERIRNLAIEIETISGELGVREGWRALVVERWSLPTRRELRAAAGGQMNLPMQRGPLPPYQIQIGESLWNHLRDGGRAILKVRQDLMQLFIDRPLAWDYALFLCHRCGSAVRHSMVPHDALIDMFASKKQSSRDVFRRLKECHDEIMVATQGPDGRPLLNASLEVVGFEQAGKKGGRRKKIWGLKVGPSAALLTDGSKKAKERVLSWQADEPDL